ncbi:MAG: FlgD immunoglobulin-like domain containing protein, partial [Elusimicrobiota bacterium]
SRLTTYNVGGPAFPGEGPRPTGQYFSYRVRAISGAGVASNWSPLAQNAATGITADILTGVSNYPNPFDSRKGGELGRTKITYTLNSDADVTITIYDALGYLVKTLTASPGTEGGKAGQNFVPWDGRNDAGALVAKGGYTARIKAKASSGSATVIRKIGVIH